MSRQTTFHRFTGSPEPATIGRFEVNNRFQGYELVRPKSHPQPTAYDAYTAVNRSTPSPRTITTAYSPRIRLIIETGHHTLVAIPRIPEVQKPPEANGFITQLFKEYENTRTPQVEVHYKTEEIATLTFPDHDYELPVNIQKVDSLADKYHSEYYHALGGRLQDWYEYLNDADEDGWAEVTIAGTDVKTSGLIFKKTHLTKINIKDYFHFHIDFSLKQRLKGCDHEDLHGETVKIRAKIFQQYHDTQDGLNFDEPISNIESDHRHWQLDMNSLRKTIHENER